MDLFLRLIFCLSFSFTSFYSLSTGFVGVSCHEAGSVLHHQLVVPFDLRDNNDVFSSSDEFKLEGIKDIIRTKNRIDCSYVKLNLSNKSFNVIQDFIRLVGSVNKSVNDQKSFLSWMDLTIDDNLAFYQFYNY